MISNEFEELNNLSASEKELALKILSEYSNTGNSSTYNELLFSDYEEIPVDIETFLHNKRYLGRGLINEEGKFTVYHYWEDTLKKLFPDPLKPCAYNTLALTGAIGLGKSFMAVICLLYELYRMLCLKDPYLYYGLQPIDKISFALMNITLDAAEGVGWDKLQQLAQSSEWFMSHGTVSKSNNPIWSPGKKIELICGSQSRHIIGRAVYCCLDGDTEILTNFGDRKLNDIVGNVIKVATVTDSGDIEYSVNCTVKPTVVQPEEYEIELEDNTIIKCTPEHRFLLIDGTYKEAKNLTKKDNLFYATPEKNMYTNFITNIFISKGRNIKEMKIKSINKNILDTPKQFYDVINANPYNNFLIKTNSGYIGSHNCFFDEVSFQPNSDVNKQKEKAKLLVNTASARMQSRFMKGEKNPTLLIVASSKRTEQSYMETFIESKRKIDNGHTYIVDEPQWVIREDKNSDRKFKVAVGSKFLSSEVLPLDITEAECHAVRNRGYQIIEVPMGYYENFIEDIDVALTDIAGMSTSNSNRYISGPRLAAVETTRYQNAFVKEIIEVGNAKEDKTEYWDFFDISRIPPELKSKPLYVHLDMSISGDKTGIGGVFQRGKKPPTEGEPPSKDMYYTAAFNVSIKAPRGYQISFEKNRKFIRWLKQQGFRVAGVSSDTFQSAETQQALAAEGFNTSIISVDRVDQYRICKPYQYLRATIYEERIEFYPSTLLKEEFIGLERDNNSGKIDHSPSGINSKDSADGITGALFNASQHAEEYAYEFGEDIETVVTVANSSNTISAEQITVDFENELKSVFSGIPKNTSKESKNIDFGGGPAVPLSGALVSEGILVW